MRATPARLLALRMGDIYRAELQPEEIRYPGLARRAQALLARHPEVYGRILEALLDGQTPQQVASQSDQALDLVRFISRIHPEIRDLARAQVIGNLEHSLSILSDRLATEGAEIPIKEVPRAIGLVTEQLALLTGSATQRIELVNVSREKLLEMFKAIKEQRKVSDV